MLIFRVLEFGNSEVVGGGGDNSLNPKIVQI